VTQDSCPNPKSMQVSLFENREGNHCVVLQVDGVRLSTCVQRQERGSFSEPNTLKALALLIEQAEKQA